MRRTLPAVLTWLSLALCGTTVSLWMGLARTPPTGLPIGFGHRVDARSDVLRLVYERRSFPPVGGGWSFGEPVDGVIAVRGADASGPIVYFLGGLGPDPSFVLGGLSYAPLQPPPIPLDRSHPPFGVEQRALTAPYWLAVVATAAAPARRTTRWASRRRRERRTARGLCPACGYDLRASSGRCPECGGEPAARARGAA